MTDDVQTLYRTIKWLGAAALVILFLGLVDYFAFEPLGQHTGEKARIVGVYHYDPKTKTTSGQDSSKFSVDEAFAAVVDWSSLPGDMVVDGRWFDEFGTAVGAVGPKPARALAEQPVVPVLTPKDFPVNLPGQYTFVVERFSGDQPVELLAKRSILVRRHL